MPKIKLKIGDRPYEISCNTGDEERIASLAASVDERVNNISKSLGQASETMVLVVTALMMEDEIRGLRSGKIIPDSIPKQSETEISDRINRCIAEALAPFTQKLEALANSLEVE